MARLPAPGSDKGTWGQILNEFLSVIHNTDGTLKDSSVQGGSLVDDTVLETKLDPAVRSKLNTVGSGGIADDTISTAKLQAGAVTNAKLQDGAVTNAKIATGTIAEDRLDTATVNKLNAAPTIAPGSITTTHILDGTLTDVDVSASANIAQSKVANLQADLTAKAVKTTQITGTGSLTGGGDLNANRTLSLVNDNATPGNDRYYGTNGAGAKGFYVLPSATVSNLDDVGNVSVATAANGQVLTYQSGNWTAATPSTSGRLSPVRTTSSLTALDFQLIICDAISSSITITLPSPVSGGYVVVKKIDTSSNSVIVMPSSGLVDGAPSVSISQQWESQDFLSDGIAWFRN